MRLNEVRVEDYGRDCGNGLIRSQSHFCGTLRSNGTFQTRNHNVIGDGMNEIVNVNDERGEE